MPMPANEQDSVVSLLRRYGSLGGKVKLTFTSPKGTAVVVGVLLEIGADAIVVKCVDGVHILAVKWVNHVELYSEPSNEQTDAVETPEHPTLKESGRRLSQAEHEIIMATLAECKGNRTQAARKLGISRRALLYKLKKLKRDLP